MGEEIEVLEDHADLAPHLGDILDVAGQLDAVDHNVAALMFLQTVDAADQGRFARSRRAADHDALTLVDRQIDVLQHVELAEPLVHPDDLDRDLVADLQPGTVDGLALRRHRPAGARDLCITH